MRGGEVEKILDLVGQKGPVVSPGGGDRGENFASRVADGYGPSNYRALRRVKPQPGPGRRERVLETVALTVTQ